MSVEDHEDDEKALMRFLRSLAVAMARHDHDRSINPVAGEALEAILAGPTDREHLEQRRRRKRTRS